MYQQKKTTGIQKCISKEEKRLNFINLGRQWDKIHQSGKTNGRTCSTYVAKRLNLIYLEIKQAENFLNQTQTAIVGIIFFS